MPSSAQLADQLVEAVPVCGEPVVVELGPGTGPVTAAIQHRLAGRGHHVAIELSDQLAVHHRPAEPRAMGPTRSVRGRGRRLCPSCRGNFPRQVGLVVRTTRDKTVTQHRGGRGAPVSVTLTSPPRTDRSRARRRPFGWADLFGPLGIGTVVAVVFLWLHNQGLANVYSGTDRAIGSLGLLTGLLSADLMLLQVFLLARIPWVERAWDTTYSSTGTGCSGCGRSG